MPEITPETIHAPQFPAIPSNEPIPASENSNENSRFEKIVNAGQRVFEKFKIIKPGRGRPRKDGKPKSSDMVAAAAAEPTQPGGSVPLAATPANPAPLDGLRVKIFVSGCVGILKGAIGFCKKWVANSARQARINPEFTQKALAECSPDEAAFKRWGDSLEVCALQYRWDFEHMPAVALATETVAMFAPFLSLAGEFKKEIARQRAKDEAQQPKETLPK